MAERAFVFGVRKKWKYFGLKVKKIETDFTAVLVYLWDLCVYTFACLKAVSLLLEIRNQQVTFVLREVGLVTMCSGWNIF